MGRDKNELEFHAGSKATALHMRKGVQAYIYMLVLNQQLRVHMENVHILANF